MRAWVVILVAGLGIAAPVAAQPQLARPFAGVALDRDAQLAVEAQAARDRNIALHNELIALESRIQTDQAIANLAAQHTTAAPLILFNPKAPPKPIEPGQWAQIPDAALAASNARAVAASENRR